MLNYAILLYLLELLKEPNIWQHFQAILVTIWVIKICLVLFSAITSSYLILCAPCRLSAEICREITVHGKVPLAFIVDFVRYITRPARKSQGVRSSSEQFLLRGPVRALSLSLPGLHSGDAEGIGVSRLVAAADVARHVQGLGEGGASATVFA